MTRERIVLLPEMEPVAERCCPVGWTFVYQAALWTVRGLYLARTRSGEREVCLILREEPGLESA